MTFKITDEVREEILVNFKKTRSPFRTARNLGYNIEDVLSVVDEVAIPRSTREEKFGGFGRPQMQKYLVARKRPWDVWDNNQPEIAKARADYEAGTHEMITGRDGDWLILYSIPRVKPQPRPNYFKPVY